MSKTATNRNSRYTATIGLEFAASEVCNSLPNKRLNYGPQGPAVARPHGIGRFTPTNTVPKCRKVVKKTPIWPVA